MSAVPLETDPCDCPPGTSRRALLRGAALVGATTVFGSTVVTVGAEEAGAVTTRGASTIVVLSLRGAADGLSLVVPHGDTAYYAARPNIAVPKASLLAPDGFFGLHPSLAPLLPLWNDGRLAAIHATGLPAPNRSHFAAMEELEDADPGSRARVGWLNRMVGNQSGRSSVKALAVGPNLPTAMVGPQPVMSFADLDTVQVAGAGARSRRANADRLRALRTQWAGATTPMAGAFREALTAVVDLSPAKAERARRSLYPEGDLGNAMSSIARTLRADLGVSAVTVDSGSWDMHLGLGGPGHGWMAANAQQLGQAIAAFFTDLGSVASRVTLVTVSEFGRRVQENANYGLDHGWGNVMLVAGAGVKGGQYYGTWPGLQNTLDADLQVTTDYRSVLAEIVAARTQVSTAKVFPGFQRERIGFMVGQ